MKIIITEIYPGCICFIAKDIGKDKKKKGGKGESDLIY